MNTQQAYINGFVKRASEYGLTESETIDLLKQATEASPLTYAALSALPLAGAAAGRALTEGRLGGSLLGALAGGIPERIYTTHMNRENPDTESLEEVALPYRLGGLLLGGGAGALTSKAFDYDPYLSIMGGGVLGRMLGAGIGANEFNKKLKDK